MLVLSDLFETLSLVYSFLVCVVHVGVKYTTCGVVLSEIFFRWLMLSLLVLSCFTWAFAVGAN